MGVVCGSDQSRKAAMVAADLMLGPSGISNVSVAGRVLGRRQGDPGREAHRSSYSDVGLRYEGRTRECRTKECALGGGRERAEVQHM